MTGQRRWQRVLLEALEQTDVIGVAAVVDRHLGRRATRSDLTAARRTAARLARGGQFAVHYVRVHPGQAAGGGVFLVLGRAGADVDDSRLQQAARGHSLASRNPAAAELERRASVDHVDQAVMSVEQAVLHARRGNVDHLTPEQADRLAGELSAAVTEIHALRERLRRRGRATA